MGDALVEGGKLTKQWLAGVMETHFDEQPAVSEVVSLAPETLGYMSTMRRVRLHWENPADKPSSVIIKMPSMSVASQAWKESAENGHEMDEYGNDVIHMMHNCECRVYSCLSKYPEFRLSTPFVYATLEVETRMPIIVMEDLEKGVTYDVADGFTEPQLYAIVDELVKLHALSFKYREVATCGINEKNCPNWQEFQKLVMGVAEQLYKQRPEYLASVGVLIRNFLSKGWFEELFQDVKTAPHTVLCHGDLWSPQVLWKGDKILGIVDWALCKQGGIMVDLLHVLSMSVSVRVRHETTEKLLEYYLEELRAKMGHIGMKCPIDMEFIKTDYKKMLPYTAALGVFAAGMWSNSPVLKRGHPDDSARIDEIMHRCKEIVDETVNAYGWT